MTFTKVSSHMLTPEQLGKLGGNSFKVYIFIRSFSDGTYKPVFPSIETLSKRTNLSISAVNRSIKNLTLSGFLVVNKVRKGTTNNNCYSFPAEANPASIKIVETTECEKVEITECDTLTREEYIYINNTSSSNVGIGNLKIKEPKQEKKMQKPTKKREPKGTVLIFDLPHTPEEIAKLERETVAWFQSKGITDNSDLLLKICEDLEFALTVKIEYSFQMKEGALRKPLNWLIGAISKHPNFNKWDYSDAIEFLKNRYNKLRVAKRVNAAIEAKRQIIRDFKAQHGNQEFASLKAKILAWLPEVERIADRNPDSTFNKELMQAIDEINKTGKTECNYIKYEDDPVRSKNLLTEYRMSVAEGLTGDEREDYLNELSKKNVIPFEKREAV